MLADLTVFARLLPLMDFIDCGLMPILNPVGTHSTHLIFDMTFLAVIISLGTTSPRN